MTIPVIVPWKLPEWRTVDQLVNDRRFTDFFE